MVTQGLEEKQDACTSVVLHEAANGGHEEALTLHPSNGAPATSTNCNGLTPLMRASRRGRLDVVQRLLKSLGAEELEERDADGRTALYHAAAGGDEKVVTLLLSTGVQPHSTRHSGATPLMAACNRGHVGVVHLLLRHVGEQGLEERSKKGWTALLHAVAGGHEKVVAALLSHGARANSKDGKGKTPLMTAAMKGHLGVVQKLQQVVGEQGLAERDVDGWTALHYAADRGHEEVVAFLASNGAQASSKSKRGITPLAQGSLKGYLNVVQQLLQVVGVQGLEDRDVDGSTALHHAAAAGHEEVVAFLSKNKGAQANSKDGKGMTPLIAASSNSHLNVVQQLLQVVGEQGLDERDEDGATALHYAADRGQVEIVATLLGHGAQASIKDGEGVTPLMNASLQGRLYVVQKLLQVGGVAGLEERDNDGRAALHFAAAEGHEEVVKFFLSHGAEANSKDNKGVRPLMHASSRGHLCVVQKLLEVVGNSGLADIEDDGRTALHHATEGGHHEVLSFLLNQGAQADSRDGQGLTPLMMASWEGHVDGVQRFLQVVGAPGLAERDKDGWTAIHYAADGDHAEVVKFLVSKGAQANSKDNKGVTPLIQASLGGHLCVVQKLLEVVGNPGLAEEDQDGRTALHHAAEGGHEEVMSFLLSHGAQANGRDHHGVTPLMLAAWRGHAGGVQMLYQVVGEQGLADTDADGWTALHFAADGDHEKVVKFLLSHGAQANSKDGEGKTPLMMASREGHIGGVQKLVEVVGNQGLADKDAYGRTALHYAASCRHKAEEVVAFLLSTGAEVQSYDSEGQTPLMLACMNDHLGVVRALLRHTNVQGVNEGRADGKTALHLACVMSYREDAEVPEEIVRALLLAGADPTVVDDEGETPRALAEGEGNAEVVSVFEWWEAELERPYLLHRAKCISDVYTKHPGLFTAPVPAFLKPRAFPRVEVVALQQRFEGTVGRKASAEARGVQEGEEERHALVVYALKEMNEQLYIELFRGFHGPINGRGRLRV